MKPTVTLDCRFLLPHRAGGVVASTRALLDGLSRAASPFLIRAHGLGAPPPGLGSGVHWEGEARWRFRLAQTVARGRGPLQRQSQLVHYPFQRYWSSKLPTVYEPHDLFWMVHPEWFSKKERDRRSRLLFRAMEGATAVIVPSQSVAQSIHTFFPRFVSKVTVVGGLCPLQGIAPEPIPVLEPFLFYPAQPWPHKNHGGLLEALSVLRRRGTEIPLVFTGFGDFSSIQKKADNEGVSEQVQFLGGVSPGQMVSLYRRCRGVIVPSFYEGYGLVAREASFFGAPVMVAARGALTEFGAPTFDPGEADSVAGAIQRLWDREVDPTPCCPDPNLEAAEKTFRVYRSCLGQ